MRVFVTGGSGYLGRNLLKTLTGRGDEARALARSDAAVKAVEAVGATAVRGDLEDVEVMTAAMRGCDVVFHSAAVAALWGDRAAFRRVNVEGTEHVARAARAAGVRRLVHVSTEAVLVDGKGFIVNADESRPLPAHPLGLYPETKGEAERRVLAAAGDGLDVVIVRPRFIWGRDDTTVLPELVRAVEDGRFKWIGGGRYLTSTCHVDNVVEGMLLAAERGRPGGIYFLTDGPPVEFRRFITDLLATRGVTPGDGRVPRPLAWGLAAVSEWLWRLLRLKGEPPITRTAICLMGGEVTVNDARARTELGYQGRVTMEEGLATAG